MKLDDLSRPHNVGVRKERLEPVMLPARLIRVLDRSRKNVFRDRKRIRVVTARCSFQEALTSALACDLLDGDP